VGPDGIHARTVACALREVGDGLPGMVTALAGELDAPPGALHAITMTGELSQRFASKAQGVDFILSAMETALPGQLLHVYTTREAFVTPAEARARPLEAAASNWVASAALLARTWPEALVVDMGSTTTDVVPVTRGRVAATGRTDPMRLATGELVYTGMVRTPAEALARAVPWGGVATPTAPDGFALVADAHLWLGTLQPEDCTAPMADGGDPTRAGAGHRLARLICADRTMVSDEDLTAIAGAIAAAQAELVEGAIRRVCGRHRAIRTALVLGLGEAVAQGAARAAGLDTVRLSEAWSREASLAGPAVAVARLLVEAQVPA
jgi:hypothetical protein